MTGPPLLSVERVSKGFPLRRSWGDVLRARPARMLHAASDVSFAIHAGESFGLVGESGCGKTTIGRMVLGLLRPDKGHIAVDGRDIATLSAAEQGPARQRLQMVFQDPYASLNPRMRVGTALAEPIRRHRVVAPDHVGREVVRLLDQVGLPADVARRYPAQLSGGQRQRVGIARALAPRPSLLVADEAVSGLDVSVRAQILNLLDDLRRDLRLALLFISHDLGTIEYLCETVAVMYLGTMVEYGRTASVFGAPAHPYTQGLLRAVPRLGAAESQAATPALQGEPPSPVDPPDGCVFRTRCPRSAPICTTRPPRVILDDGRWAACHFAQEVSTVW